MLGWRHYNPALIILQGGPQAKYEYMVDLWIFDAHYDALSVIPRTEEDKAVVEVGRKPFLSRRPHLLCG